MEEEQKALWNGVAGEAWVDAQAVLDRTFAPIERLLVDAVSAKGDVLDVGCGTGATTLALARGRGGRTVGVDISEPMIAAARGRAERERSPATFIVADAQTHAIEAAAFDAVVSRFGVMFFDNPVAAFTNLRSAARKDALLRLVVWRSPAENPFMTTAERAAAPLLPNVPARRADGPGQFAFADAERVRSILGESGWSEIALRPIDVPCTFPETELNRYITRMGPVGRVLHELEEPSRSRIAEVVRAAFEPFVHAGDVRFDAACWMVCARA
jgi:SAM-dependent methyltransferase